MAHQSSAVRVALKKASDGGEDGLSRLVAALPLDRRNAVLAFVTERVATCPYCGTDVRCDSARGLDADEQLGCLQAMRRTRLRRFFDTGGNLGSSVTPGSQAAPADEHTFASEQCSVSRAVLS